jgi:hypothetical protein
MRRFQRAAALVVAATTMSTAACTGEHEQLQSLSFGDGRSVLVSHQAVSDGQPVAFGPYLKGGGLSAYAGCLGDGQIEVRFYADEFTPNIFTDRHQGAIAYVTSDCNGALGGVEVDEQTAGTQYCIVATFTGKVSDYKVIITQKADQPTSSPNPTINSPAPSPSRLTCRTGS